MDRVFLSTHAIQFFCMKRAAAALVFSPNPLPFVLSIIAAAARDEEEEVYEEVPHIGPAT